MQSSVIVGIMVVRPYFGLGLIMAFLERVFMGNGLEGEREKVDYWGSWWERVRGWEHD